MDLYWVRGECLVVSDEWEGGGDCWEQGEKIEELHVGSLCLVVVVGYGEVWLCEDLKNEKRTVGKRDSCLI